MRDLLYQDQILENWGKTDMNFVVDHSGTWRVVVGNKRWTILGWTQDGRQVRPIVVNDQNRPELVHSGVGAWHNYQLERA